MLRIPAHIIADGPVERFYQRFTRPMGAPIPAGAVYHCILGLGQYYYHGLSVPIYLECLG